MKLTEHKPRHHRSLVSKATKSDVKDKECRLRVSHNGQTCYVARSVVSNLQLCQISKHTVRVCVAKHVDIKLATKAIAGKPMPLITTRRSTRRSVSKADSYRSVTSEDCSSSMTGNTVGRNGLKPKIHSPKPVSDLKSIVKKEDMKTPIKNETKDDNKEENKLNGKRKLRSSVVNNSLDTKDKKSKSDETKKSLNGGNSNRANNSANNQKKNKNKENQNKGSSGLSRVIGLPNIGNTCYINSIIQVLRITPGFRQFVCKLNKMVENKTNDKLQPSDTDMIRALHNIFVTFGLNTDTPDISTLESNEKVITALVESDNIRERFESGLQQDCHEFLNWLINELNSYAERLFPSGNRNGYRRRSFIKPKLTFESFSGVMSRKISCSECTYSSTTDDHFEDVQIPLCISEEMPENPEFRSFSEIIHRKDYLTDDNKFECRNCSKKTEASVVNHIKTPPKLMIVYIKKPLDCHQMSTRNAKPMKRLFKVDKRIDYSFCNRKFSYSLYALVIHDGPDNDNGHYYAFVDSTAEPSHCGANKGCKCSVDALANNGWIKVNDHKVTKIGDNCVNKRLNDESMDSMPYLAFYRQI